MSVAQLRAWNGLKTNAVLRIGQVLRLAPRGQSSTASRTAQAASPSAKVHIVRAGESLWSLARRYGVTVQTLRTANSLSPSRPLLAGQRLTIPS